MFYPVRLGAYSTVLACACALSVPPLARAERLVVVRATADASYLEKRAQALAADPEKTESFVFMKGRYFEAGVGDRSLERMPFSTIAETLAKDLAGQRYRPAPGLREADLLLVVHWGMTERVEADFERFPGSLPALGDLERAYQEARDTEAADTSGNAALTGLSTAIGQQIDAEIFKLGADQMSYDLAAGSTAELLGFNPTTKDDQRSLFGTERERTLLAMAREERYFIIVMAYDCQSLMREGKSRRLWTSRMSIRSPGVNFPIALTRMSLAAGPTFGTRQKELVFKRVRNREGVVEVGEPVVVGDDAPREPAP